MTDKFPTASFEDSDAGPSKTFGNHYEVLNLPSFEPNADIIAEAIDLSRIELDTSSADSPDYQALHQRLVEATDTLGDSNKKQEYDVELRRSLLLQPARRREAASGETHNSPTRVTAPTSGILPKKATDSGVSLNDLAPAVDSSFDSDFELLDVVGRGASSVVHRAYDCKLRRYVAIKQLDESEADSHAVSQFWKEAEFVAGLGDDHIVRVFGVDKTRKWVISEWMESDIGKVVQRGPSSPDLVRSVLRQTLRGLQALHNQQVLHGQIKPTNLLVTGGGKVKLSATPGFGYEGEFHIPENSYRHVAPELLRPDAFGPVGPGADLYQLGFVAIEMLLGDDLDEIFRCGAADGQNSPMAWLRWHGSISETIAEIGDLVPELPDDVRVVLQGLIQKNVADRYHSAEMALNALMDRPLRLIDLLKDSSSSPSTPDIDSIGDVAVLDLKKLPVVKPHKNSRFTRKQLYYMGAAAFAMVLLVMAFLSAGAVAEPDRCRLSIDCEPSGASIYIDGSLMTAPTSGVVEVTPGDHQIRVELDGYETLLETIIAKHGKQSQTLKYKLQSISPKICQVSIHSLPPDAEILINGVSTGCFTDSVLDLSPGSYELALRRRGCHLHTTKLTVADSVSSYTAHLKPEDLQLRIATEPAGAHVELNGEVIAQLTPVKMSIEPGRYRVAARLDGFEPNTEEFDITDKDVNLKLSLIEEAKTVPVLITSHPSDAEVSIDGKVHGSTPLTIDLVPGQYEIVLSHEGYRLKQSSLVVGEFPQMDRYRLEPAGGHELPEYLIPSRTVGPALLAELERALSPKPTAIEGFHLTPEEQNRVVELIREALSDNWQSKSTKELDLRLLSDAYKITPYDLRVQAAAGLACEYHYHGRKAEEFYKVRPRTYSIWHSLLLRRRIYLSALSADLAETQLASSLCADLVESIPVDNAGQATSRRTMLQNVRFASELGAYFELVQQATPAAWTYTESEQRIKRSLAKWPGFLELYVYLKADAIEHLKKELKNSHREVESTGYTEPRKRDRSRKVRSAAPKSSIVNASYSSSKDDKYDDHYDTTPNASLGESPYPPRFSRRECRHAYHKLFVQSATEARSFLLHSLPKLAPPGSRGAAVREP